MSDGSSRPTDDAPAEVPRSFASYLRSFGPGLVVVLTWLGAGDIVEAGVAGGNYGYALMWVIVVALLMRFFFVSLIAKYQLCNPRGEGVLDGLARLHRLYPPFLLLVAVVMGHVYGAYMVVGVGETSARLVGRGATWQWAVLWTIVAWTLVFRPIWGRVEAIFKVLLAVLSLSFLGSAVWVGISPSGIARGVLAFEMPQQTGRHDSLLIAVGMLGAIGGSLMNLVYPYMLERKGWRGPEYRRVQMYDFLLAVLVMIILDLAVWTLGAELVHAEGGTITDLASLTQLLAGAVGRGGEMLFYLGVFAAVFTSLVGHAIGLGWLSAHAWLRIQAGPTSAARLDYENHPLYRAVVVWVLVSPLIWTLPNMPDFVTLTLIANSLQVVLIPLLAGGLWWITASERFIGSKYRTRTWENLVMLVIFCLSLWGAVGAVLSVVGAIRALTG